MPLPQKLGTTELGRRSWPLNIDLSLHKKYGVLWRKLKPAMAYVFPPLIHSVVIPHRSTTQTNHAEAVSSEPTPTQQFLPHEAVEHPPEVGVHNHTSPVRPSTLPFLRWRVRQFTFPPPIQILPTQDVARCLARRLSVQTLELHDPVGR